MPNQSKATNSPVNILTANALTAKTSATRLPRQTSASVSRETPPTPHGVSRETGHLSPSEQRASDGFTSGQGWDARAFTHETMGMTVSLHVRATDPRRPDIAAAATRAFATLDRADRVFSTYHPDSDLMRVRRGELNEADADPWFAEVRNLCVEAKSVTGGLFTDHLTGPDGSAGFDPTGLVKGWAAQKAAEELRTLPGVAFCLNAAGDLTAGIGSGELPSGLPTSWRVGIADPTTAREVAHVVQLEAGQALATSGVAERGAHIIDPRTHRPATDASLRSVTVVGPDLTWADVWATACFIDPDALAFSRMAASYRVVASSR